MIYLNLKSTRHHGYRINSFVPDCMEHGLYFETEEEYKKAIEQYASILSQYGIPFPPSYKKIHCKIYYLF